MNHVAAYLGSLRPGLPSEVYVLQAGLVINAFGNGAANPFLVLYLAEVRDIPLALAGLAASLSAACSLVAAAISGSLADRRGARPTMIAGLLLSALGFGLYPLVREPWHALALAPLTGIGVGTWLTLQSTALALLVPAALRHAAFAQQRVAANLGLGLGGFAGGVIVTTGQPNTFTALFLLNTATFFLYAAFILRLRLPEQPTAGGDDGGYLTLLRDRAFRRLLLLNFAFVVSAIALLNGLFPVFAKNEAGASEDVIGALFLLNALVIITVQLPVAKAVEGRRRSRSLAFMCLLFACCWTLAEVAGLAPEGALLLLVAAICCLSLGECLYDAVYGPLVADLAPNGTTGRAMGASGLSWQLGFITAPALGGAVLGAEPLALWPLAIVVALIAGVASLRLEQVLAPDLRRTPRRAAPLPVPEPAEATS